MTNALALIRQWSDLPAPSLDDLVGTWKAEFVPPLRHIGPIGLGLMGLPRWYGKRFEWDGDELAGVNLVRSNDSGLQERLSMRAVMGVSAKDRKTVGVITYGPDAPIPWRWIRDEVRCDDSGALVGMSFLDVPGVRGSGLPFFLKRTQ